MTEEFNYRRAVPADRAALQAMHRRSLLTLGRSHYSDGQLRGLLATIDTVDDALLEDGTYIIAEQAGRIVAAGGWTMQQPAYELKLGGVVSAPDRQATIRAVFVDPDFARRGLARRILEAAESEAVLLGGAERIGLVSTLTGLPFYRKLGYLSGAPVILPLTNGMIFPGRRMRKQVADEIERPLLHAA
jgi:GNAT superfamily N-acetyltransferase